MADAAAKGPGPPPVRFERLLQTPSRVVVTGVGIVKAAAAATIAFEIAELLGPARFAFLAPVVAVFTVQGSVLGTLGQGIQRVLGNVVGVALASIWVQAVGTHWWSLLIALLVAVPVAGRLPLGTAGQAQVTLAVLLTVAAGPAVAGYGQWRVADCIIGGIVGIAVGVGIPERPRFDQVRTVQLDWADSLADHLDTMARELALQRRQRLGPADRHGFIDSSRELYQVAVGGRNALAVASEGVHFNPWGRRERENLDDLSDRQRQLVRLTLQIRTLSLTVDQLYDRDGPPPRLTAPTLADLLDQAAALLRAQTGGVLLPPASGQLHLAIADCVTAVTTPSGDAYAVLDSVTLLGRVEQLRQEIGRPPSDRTDEPDEALPDVSLPDDPGGR